MAGAHVHSCFGGTCKPGEISRYVFLPGDPERVQKIASRWDTSKNAAGHYSFVVQSGTLNGQPVCACSTGIGGPSVGIAVEELAGLGADTFIRVGITGTLQPEVRLGDLIINTGAVRLDGTSEDYVVLGYPAMAHYEVVMALIEAVESLGVRYHLGIVASTASYGCGQGREGFSGYLPSRMKDLVAELKAARVYNMETESATLFTLASIYGLRAGSINAVVEHRLDNTYMAGRDMEEAAIDVVTKAMCVLMKWDQLKLERGSRWLTPDIITASRG